MKTPPEKEYVHKILKKVGRAINEYGLIRGADRCLVAMSGGRDSQVLLDTIAGRRKYLPVTYDVAAVHVDVRAVPYEVDRNYLEGFCSERNVPLFFQEVDIAISSADAGEVCFRCSRQRRNVLFDMMRELRCNRLVFGHHMDDIIETLFMNMLYQGSISTMPPKLAMFHGEFDIIRPLCLLTKDEIREYARINGFPEQKQECPYGKSTERSEAAKIIEEFTARNQNAKQTIYNSMNNIKLEYLPQKDNSGNS